eukprot:4986091-Alexandrium_andersonii.AAC.1
MQAREPPSPLRLGRSGAPAGKGHGGLGTCGQGFHGPCLCQASCSASGSGILWISGTCLCLCPALCRHLLFAYEEGEGGWRVAGSSAGSAKTAPTTLPAPMTCRAA